MKNLWRLVAVTGLSLGVPLGLASVTLASKGTAGAATSKTCASVTTGGHTYGVSATAVSCKTADKAVKKLAAKRLKAYTANASLSGGPRGYHCDAATKSRNSALSTPANVQVDGSCSKGALGGAAGAFGNSPYFNWSTGS
jgi:hypothetical protein